MKKRTGEILELLDEKYGTEFICYLNYETPWQLLIATMLSAQCTDARVNIVTKDLFLLPIISFYVNSNVFLYILYSLQYFCKKQSSHFGLLTLQIVRPFHNLIFSILQTLAS